MIAFPSFLTTYNLDTTIFLSVHLRILKRKASLSEKSSAETEKWVLCTKQNSCVTVKAISIYLHFEESINRQLLCTKTINKGDLEELKKKVKENYLFEMFVGTQSNLISFLWSRHAEDIAVGDYLGFHQDDKIFLSTHIYFKIWYDALTGVGITRADWL